MTLVKWYDRPNFNEWFDPFFIPEQKDKKSCGCSPATNITETPEAFTLEMAVPGMNKEDFNIALEKEVLSISSEKEGKTDEAGNYTRREFSTGPFKRSYIIPKSVNTETIVADYKDGILTVTLPKKEEARLNLSKQISVN